MEHESYVEVKTGDVETGCRASDRCLDVSAHISYKDASNKTNGSALGSALRNLNIRLRPCSKFPVLPVPVVRNVQIYCLNVSRGHGLLPTVLACSRREALIW